MADARGQVIQLFEVDEEIQQEEWQAEAADDEAAQGVLIITEGGTTAKERTIRLNYEKQGQSILVPARVGARDAFFLFDTGATYTTLTEEFARQAGVSPAQDAPVTMVQTAAGVTQTRFGLMDRFTLGASELDYVSFTVCDACGMGTYQGRPIAGLLGLNVLRRYRVSVDDSQGVIELEPHGDFHERSADIEPWLEAELTTVEVDSVTVEVRNRAPKRIDRVTLDVTCLLASGEEVSDQATIRSVAADSSTEVALSASLGTCRQFDASVAEGRW